MTHKPKKHEKSKFAGHGIRSSDIGIPNELVGKPINLRGVSLVGEGSIIHVLSKEDIKYELSQIETKFGMTSAEFYRAWKEGRLHGHEAMKLGSYYEFYKDEYE